MPAMYVYVWAYQKGSSYEIEIRMGIKGHKGLIF